MTNKLELHRAAQDTAIKLNAAKNARAKAGIVTSDFDELGIDVKHFDTFAQIVSEEAYRFAALENQPLEPVVNAPVTPA
jgi:hypothetical protein